MARHVTEGGVAAGGGAPLRGQRQHGGADRGEPGGARHAGAAPAGAAARTGQARSAILLAFSVELVEGGARHHDTAAMGAGARGRARREGAPSLVDLARPPPPRAARRTKKVRPDRQPAERACARRAPMGFPARGSRGTARLAAPRLVFVDERAPGLKHDAAARRARAARRRHALVAPATRGRTPSSLGLALRHRAGRAPRRARRADDRRRLLRSCRNPARARARQGRRRHMLDNPCGADRVPGPPTSSAPERRPVPLFLPPLPARPQPDRVLALRSSRPTCAASAPAPSTPWRAAVGQIPAHLFDPYECWNYFKEARQTGGKLPGSPCFKERIGTSLTNLGTW